MGEGPLELGWWGGVARAHPDPSAWVPKVNLECGRWTCVFVDFGGNLVELQFCVQICLMNLLGVV